ncbi:MAG: hypothetical protein AAF235_03870 [Planctomycetota bacterium]
MGESRGGTARAAWADGLTAAGLVATALLVLGVPGVGIVRSLAMLGLGAALDAAGTVVGPLVVSALTAAGIGVLAAAIGVPIGWVIASAGRIRALAVVLLMPLVLPQTIAFAGWGVLRSPETMLGNAIVGAAQDGARWLPIVVSRGLAVLGLAFWAAPLAGVVQAVAFASTPRALIEQGRLSSPSVLRRWALLMRVHAGAIGLSAAVVGMLMLGSAVPLHLSNLPTHATVIWLELTETSLAERGRVWAAASPAVLLAGVLAVAMVASMSHAVRGSVARGDQVAGGLGVRASGGAVGLACAAWCCAFLVPVLLLAVTVRDWAVVFRFPRFHADAVWSSLATSGVVGVLVLLVGVACGRAFGSPRRFARVAAWLVFGALLATALTPGVLIGAAMNTAYGSLGGSSGGSFGGSLGSVSVILSMLARFGVLGAFAGLWMAWREDASLRADGALHVRDTVRAWWVFVLSRRLLLPVGAAIASACLTLHEIEASVMVRPPGPDNLARLMLDALHFARMDELAAVILLVAAAAAPIAAAGMWAVLASSRK